MARPQFALLRAIAPQSSSNSRAWRRLRIDSLEDRTAPAAFTPGNLVVLRVGDGTNTLNTTAAAVSLVEMTTGGGSVQSISLPSTGSIEFTLRGAASTEGILTRSSNGEFLTFGGYRAALSDANPSAATTVDRVIGKVGFDGVVNTS